MTIYKSILSLISLICISGFQNEYTITIFNDIYLGWDVVPYNVDDEYLMLMTGLYNGRYIFYFNKSYDLYNTTYFSSPYFNYSEIIKAGNNSILITTSASIEVFDGKNLKNNNTNNIRNPRRTFKKINSYYYHAFCQQIYPYNLIIDKMYLENNALKILKSYTIRDLSYQNTISCDATSDENFHFLCAYISGQNIKILSLDEELNFVSSNTMPYLSLKTDDFFKLFHFKDKNEFIFISCVNDKNLILSYFKYDNNNIINLLDKISNYNQRYLLFKDTQNNGKFNFNDAIPISSNKIIKISTNDKFNITIIQFYNDYSIVTSKNYIIEKFDKNPYPLYKNVRLGLFRNALVVSFLVSKNNNSYWFPSFFFIGNEKYNYTEINNNNNIKISKLISIENNIYSRAHIKIISIPENFEFTNFYTDDEKSEIKPGTYLDIQDEIVFKKYKKNTSASFIFSYFVFDDESSYNKIQIIPEGIEIPSESKYIEGKQRKIDILIKDCNDGFYGIENDEEICIKDKPEGYYLDVTYNMYRKCYHLCADCETGSTDDHDMKCLKCINGFIIKNSTSNCISEESQETEINLTRKTSLFYVWFIIILCFAFIISFTSIFIDEMRKFPGYLMNLIKHNKKVVIQEDNPNNSGKNTELIEQQKNDL